MKAIRWLLKLVLAMMTLPLIPAVWLIKWFVVFLHHCSAWTFYLLGSVVLATAVLSFLMQQSQGIEALQMLIGGFVIFMIPQVVGGVVVGRTKDQILSERKDLCIGQYRIILSADTASEVRQMLSQKLDVLSSILATQMPCRSRRSGA